MRDRKDLREEERTAANVVMHKALRRLLLSEVLSWIRP